VSALLLPSMRPYRRFVLKTDTFTGTFVATKVQFTGDNFGGSDFNMRITAKPQGAIVPEPGQQISPDLFRSLWIPGS
jgi:hypothetical protein